MTTFTAYHGTNASFRRFDPKRGAQGIIWFSSDRETIERGESGAQGTARILELRVTIDRPAGWREYDQLMLDEIESRGFDGVLLPRKDGFDGFVFDPRRVSFAPPTSLAGSAGSLTPSRRNGRRYSENPYNRSGRRIEGKAGGWGYAIDYEKSIAEDEQQIRELEAIGPLSQDLNQEELDAYRARLRVRDEPPPLRLRERQRSSWSPRSPRSRFL